MAMAGAGGEAERVAALLRRITGEGGFAFVASAEKAAAGDLRAAEAAREMAWEQLHSGPWSEVGAAWRDAYALACLHVARLRVRGGAGGERPAALRALDMGLIMGGSLLRADLEAAVARISAEPCGGGGGAEAVDEEDERWREGLDRNRDIADALKILPAQSLSCKKVERRSCISLEEFICNYFLHESPVIISGTIDHWPARTKWKDIKYLKKIAGDRTVPVEVGKNYVCSEWKQELITFSQFLERMWSTGCPSNLTYLAQHPLFEQIKELSEDIMVPDYCYAGGGELQSLNAWFGPHGTVTPLHHDPHHNILAQVLGRKYIRLYPASITEDLYPHTETMLSNTSQVDLDNIDLKEFPKAESLGFMDCILEEGDLLYIPPKWWHYVRSLSTSFSVSFWWRATVQPSGGS
ncbi:lysine-specific demethylase JMJ30-like isoform X1 [Phragmites australis]|uniref:lysine-specific demethylase JMJ30-like isoform X1 n=1 Tax=Phragmites australis TaxID=29695 RepID=UPI002D789AD8|nr:lysine-specific demethylase JMJ30-like isoform X1 [Phragmites australis]